MYDTNFFFINYEIYNFYFHNKVFSLLRLRSLLRFLLFLAFDLNKKSYER